jgi:hypothetical protein
MCGNRVQMGDILWDTLVSTPAYLCVECSGHQAIENQRPHSLHTLEWPMDTAGALQLHVCP